MAKNNLRGNLILTKHEMRDTIIAKDVIEW